MFRRSSLLSVLVGITFSLVAFPSAYVHAADCAVDHWDFNGSGTDANEGWNPKHTEPIDGQPFEVKTDDTDNSKHALFINPTALPSPTSTLAPRIEGPKICLQAADYSVIEIGVKSSANEGNKTPPFNDKARVFFRTDADSNSSDAPFDPAKGVPFRIFNNGSWQVIDIYVGNHKLWQGTITQIRVDPPPNGGRTGKADDLVAFDYIKLIKKVDDTTRNKAQFGPIFINGQVRNEITVAPGDNLEIQFQITNIGTRGWTDVNGHILAWQNPSNQFPNNSSFREWRLGSPNAPNLDDGIAPNDPWSPTLKLKDGTEIIAPTPKTATDYTLTFAMIQKPQGAAFDPVTAAFNPEATATIVVHVVPGPLGLCLKVSKTQLDFQAQSGDTTNPPSQQFSITNCGDGTLNWSVNADQNWVLLKPASGTNSGTVSVGVDLAVAGITEKETATITVTGIGATHSPQMVFLTLTVRKVPVIYVTGWPGTELSDAQGLLIPPCGELDSGQFGQETNSILSRFKNLSLDQEGENPKDVIKVVRVVQHLSEMDNPCIAIYRGAGLAQNHDPIRIPFNAEGGFVLLENLIKAGYKGPCEPRVCFRSGFDLPYPFDTPEAQVQLQSIPADANLFLFPYDWRRDLREASAELAKAVTWVLAHTGSSKVDIITHSTGGLVARYYLNVDGGVDKIRNLFLMAVPNHGLAIAYLALLKDIVTLDKVGVLNPMLQKLGKLCSFYFALLTFGQTGGDCDRVKAFRDITVLNWPAVYDLMPSRKYFELYGSLFDDQCNEAFEDFHHFKTCETASAGPIDGGGDPDTALRLTYTENIEHNNLSNSILLRKAFEFRNALGDGVRPDFAGNVFLVVGIENATITGIRKKFDRSACNYVFGTSFIEAIECTDAVQFQLLFQDGDTGVPTKSASELDLGSGRKAPVYLSARLFPNRKKLDHGTLVDEDPCVALHIKDIVIGEDPKDKQLRVQCEDIQKILKEEREAAKDLNKIEVEVLSPADLQITDSKGNHIGLDPSRIVDRTGPDASYWTVGSSKVAILPADDHYEILARGQREGIVHVVVTRRLRADYTPKEEMSYRFETQENSTFRISAYNPDTTTVPFAEVDRNGDGIIDEILGPTIFFDGVEGGINGWKARGLWHIGEIGKCAAVGPVTAFTSPSPIHAWYFGDETTCIYAGSSILESPIIPLPNSAPGVFVSFKYFIDLRLPDIASVSVSFDGGRRYKAIWSSAAGAIFGNWAESGNIFVSKPTGAKSVRIRFFLKGKKTRTPGGWLIDNVQVQQAPTPQVIKRSETELGSLELSDVSLTQLWVGVAQVGIFRAQGRGIYSTHVKVFDLSGRCIYDSGEVVGDTIQWNETNSSKKSLSNGVYLYKLIVGDGKGVQAESEIRKLIILR